MSESNIHVVRAAFEAYNAGDMDAFSEFHDPNVAWMYLEGWPEAETLVGREACLSQWRRMRSAFDVDTVEPITDFVAAGDRVVVRLIWHGTGEGPEMNMELTNVFTVRKSKILIIEPFWNHAEALQSIGLTE
jgi:ketosteroid isomerase-like protein